MFQRPSKLNCVEVAFKRAIAKMGRHYIPGRAGVTTDGVLNNKYRARCAGRGRCGRGCDINAAFHSPTALIYPARDSGNLTVRPYSVVSEVLLGEASNRATGVRVIDANTREVMDFKAPVVVLGAGALDTHAHPAQLASRARTRTASGIRPGVLGCYLSEHIMGIRGQRLHPGPHRDRGDAGRRPSRRAVHPAVPQRHRQAPRLHPRLPLPGRRRLPPSIPGMAHDIPGFGKAFKSNVRKYYPALISFGGFGEVLPRKENRVTLDPVVKDAWGIPVLALRLHLPRQRAEDGEGHGGLHRGDAAWRRRPRTSRSSASRCRPAGRFTRSAPRAWATIRETSVTDRFCRLHDAKNVYIADAAPFVSGGTQNTTWSILAMAGGRWIT